MRSLKFCRYELSMCALVAMFTGCGGHEGATVPAINAAPDSLSHHRTFLYTGSAQVFKVPAQVTQLTVVADGAQGAALHQSTSAHGGRVSAVVPVTPGEELGVYVGGEGSGANGGFNGGANGGGTRSGSPPGYGGGGASDVRQHGDGLADRILVSGGGGGQGGGFPKIKGGVGGKGGAKIGGSGGDGACYTCGSEYTGGGGGEGGSPQVGGSGGLASTCAYSTDGYNGKLLDGGAGGQGFASSGSFYGPSGGGGGGGGGGSWQLGGLCTAAGGGGGGGSSYAESSATNVHMWQGWHTATGNGLIVFSW